MSGRTWMCSDVPLALDQTLVMGVLNVTPDSFSDGGTYEEPIVAVPAAVRMCEDGATIVDVGGESSRPGATEITADEETERVLPIVERLVDRDVCPVSVDTRHATVARAACCAGAKIINDISGFRAEGMVEVAAGCDAGLVVMHMQGEPGTMQSDPSYDDVVSEVVAFLAERADVLESAGVVPERICVDPGIGFGKTLDHNLALLRNLPRLCELGYPVLVGVSRKSMIGTLLQIEDPRGRVSGSVGASVWCALNGADILRVHDVSDTVDAVRVAEAIGR